MRLSVASVGDFQDIDLPLSAHIRRFLGRASRAAPGRDALRHGAWGHGGGARALVQVLQHLCLGRATPSSSAALLF
eukprot:4357045-Pyramimonas_sp.AAC.1